MWGAATVAPQWRRGGLDWKDVPSKKLRGKEEFYSHAELLNLRRSIEVYNYKTRHRTG
jgi:hypothetical protein